MTTEVPVRLLTADAVLRSDDAGFEIESFALALDGLFA